MTKTLRQCAAAALLAGVLVSSNALGGSFTASLSVHAMGENDLVPLRTVAEVQGAKVSWDQKEKSITIERGSDIIVLTVGEKQATVNGAAVELDKQPIMQGNRTYISLDTINDLFSSQVEWDAEQESIVFSQADIELKATQFIYKLFSSDTSNITTYLSQALKEIAPVDEMWSTVGQQYSLIVGQPVKLQAISIESNDVHTNAVLSYETSNIPLQITVRFDQEGYVDDLYIDIAASAIPYSKPNYDKGNYIEEEVVIGEGAFRLPGTLTVPEGEGPFPTVILVHGSGPHDRDSTIQGTKVFKDLAAGLAAKNIAVLRYEKITKEHTFKVSGLPHFTLKNESVDDVFRAIEYLQQHEAIDKEKIYVAGHSQGGFVIPMMLQQDKNHTIAGAILISAPSSSFIDALVEQQHKVVDKMKTLGLPEEMIASQEQYVAIMDQMKEMLQDPAYSTENLPVAFPSSPAYWWYEQREYVPAEVIQETTAPLLIVQGENDWQVSMEQFEGWKQALEANRQATFTSYPAMNHLLTNYEGVSIGLEYSTPANVTEKLITDMANWIEKQGK